MKIIVPFFLLIVVMFACKKEFPTPNNGIYRGVFREILDSGDTLASGVVYLALFEETNSYSLVGDSITNAPATQNGTYNIESGQRIDYSTTSTYNTVYDVDHYLDTLYSYIFDDEIFEFWFQDGTKKYEYRLTRD